LVCGVWEFWGLTGFYQRFVEQYATLSKPLFEATNRTASGGTRQFVCTTDLEVAFERLKRALTTAPVLSALNKGNREFTLHCDASKFALGAMLSQ
jgi:hypothetical protein